MREPPDSTTAQQKLTSAAERRPPATDDISNRRHPQQGSYSTLFNFLPKQGGSGAGPVSLYTTQLAHDSTATPATDAIEIVGISRQRQFHFHLTFGWNVITQLQPFCFAHVIKSRPLVWLSPDAHERIPARRSNGGQNGAGGGRRTTLLLSSQHSTIEGACLWKRDTVPTNK